MIQWDTKVPDIMRIKKTLVSKKLCVSPEFMISDYITYERQYNAKLYNLTPQQMNPFKKSLEHLYML